MGWHWRANRHRKARSTTISIYGLMIAPLDCIHHVRSRADRCERIYLRLILWTERVRGRIAAPLHTFVGVMAKCVTVVTDPQHVARLPGLVRRYPQTNQADNIRLASPPRMTAQHACHDSPARNIQRIASNGGPKNAKTESKLLR